MRLRTRDERPTVGRASRAVPRDRRRLLLGLALCAAAALSPASALAKKPAAPRGGPEQALHVDGRRLADARGGTVILRGGATIDKKSPGLPVLTDEDWAKMRRIGWNSIRLGTAWEFIEPERGRYDADYLDRLAELAEKAMAEGFYVVLDMHQDVWGPPLGNGAAPWTVYPECAALLADIGGPTGVWAANYLSPWTACQFTRFWDDLELQQHFIRAWQEVARRLGDEPRLAGYDLINEPFQGLRAHGEFEQRALYPFYSRVAAAIREVDRDAVIFEEPPNSKNVHTPTTPAIAPRGGNVVYGPHVYGLWDWHDAFTERAALVESNMRYSDIEAKAMDVPLWYGEFGMRRGVPGGEDTLSQIYDIADAQLAGTAYWEWSAGGYGTLLQDGRLDAVRARTLSRAYPLRTGGLLRGFSFDAASRRFEMTWQGVGNGRVTWVYVPDLAYPHGYDVRSDAAVTWTELPDRQRLEVKAEPGMHTLVITPRAGS